MLLTGAEIVVECLKEQGVDTVFVRSHPPWQRSHRRKSR